MRILAIGAHPDDIEPQIGGTLASYVADGHKVTVVASVSTATGAGSIKGRDSEGFAAAKCIGANFLSLGFSSSEFTFSRKYINEFDRLIASEKPSLVFTVSGEDSHNEHVFVHNCLKSSLRKNLVSWVSIAQAFPGGIGRHQQNFYKDISSYHEAKMEAVRCYSSQVEKYGDTWLAAIEARDRAWGFNIGVEYAEVAFINKWIIR